MTLAAVLDREHSRVVGHPVYDDLRDVDSLRRFMEHHVWAVWDFMALLARLRSTLGSRTAVWTPRERHGDALRFVNELFVVEETDRWPDGSHGSHFAMYHRAMQAAGADTDPVDAFLLRLESGWPVASALNSPGIPEAARDFVLTTFRTMESGLPAMAGAFAYGRERLIPAMFEQLLRGSVDRAWWAFRFYLQRHVEVDSGEHGALADRLVEVACGMDALRWEAAEDAARASLRARAALWDSVVA